jgi:ribosomal protein L37E
MGEGSRLREYLAGRDAPCPRCGYNLRDLKDEVCPECGAPISIKKLTADEEHRLWRERRMVHDPITMTGLVGSLLGLGCPGMFLASVAGTGGHLGRVAAGVVVIAVQFGFFVLYLTRMRVMAVWPRDVKVALAIAAWMWGWLGGAALLLSLI